MHTKRLACRNLWFQKLKLHDSQSLSLPGHRAWTQSCCSGPRRVLLGAISREPTCPASHRCPDFCCVKIMWWPALLSGSRWSSCGLRIHRLRDYRGYRWTLEGCGEFPVTAGTARSELQLRDIRESLCMIAPALLVHLRENVKEKAELTKALRLAREEKESSNKCRKNKKEEG